MLPKIAFLKRPSKEAGGLEKHTEKLLNAFAKKGEVFLLDFSDKLCQKWILEHKPDIVFGMDRNSFQTHLRAGNGVHRAYLERRKLFEPFHLFFINPRHRKILSMEKKAFECPKLKKLFVNSYMVKEELLSYYEVDPKKIEVVHNGVEWKEWQQPFDAWEEERPKLLKKWNLEDTLNLVFIGNGFQRKGLSILLKALAKMDHPLHLSVIGRDKNEMKYQKLAKKLKLENVHFFGRQAVLPFYQLADAIVIPSIYDPFANVTVEALAMGLFVLSSPYNGGKEVMKSGEILESLDVDHLALQLKKIEKKTASSAKAVREEIRYLDFDHQITKIVDATLC